MHKQSKEPTVCISARIEKSLRERLRNKHPKDGEISKVLKALLQRYAEGRILGLKLEV